MLISKMTPRPRDKGAWDHPTSSEGGVQDKALSCLCKDIYDKE